MVFVLRSSLTSSCIIMYVATRVWPALLIMLEMMMSIVQEVKGLTILHYTFQEEDQFTCKNFGPLFNELK